MTTVTEQGRMPRDNMHITVFADRRPAPRICEKQFATNPDNDPERDFTLTAARQHDLANIGEAMLMPQCRMQWLRFPAGDPLLVDVKKRLARNPDRDSDRD